MGRRMQPLSGEGPLVDFAGSLRKFQVRTGGRVIDAENWGASRTAIYSALAGKRLPTPETLDAMVLGWGGGMEPLERWRRTLRQAEEALAEASRLRGEVTVKQTDEEVRFQQGLLEVWRQAGEPSHRRWGSTADISPRAIAAYLEGTSLPTPARLERLIEGLGFLYANDYKGDARVFKWWLEERLDVLRGEHLFQARIARKKAREEARTLARSLPGGRTGLRSQGPARN